jgi:hypothetical protein
VGDGLLALEQLLRHHLAVDGVEQGLTDADVLEQRVVEVEVEVESEDASARGWKVLDDDDGVKAPVPISAPGY